MEQVGRQSLRQEPNRKLNGIRAFINLDSSNREPREELLHLNPRNIGQRPIAQFALDMPSVVDQISEFDIAIAFEFDFEATVVGENVGLDIVG